MTAANQAKPLTDMRFDALDGCRGLCALMVVLLHAPIAGPIGQSGFVRHSFLFVDFFFVLSGFVIAHSWGARLMAGKRWADFIQARFWRVYPLHFAMLMLFLVFELIMRGGRGWEGAQTPETFLHNLLLTHSLGFVSQLSWNYPSWSISAEFVSYILFAALAVGAARWLRAILPILALAGSAFLLVRLGHIEAHVDYGWLRCLVGFSLGALLRLFLWERLRCDEPPAPTGRWTLLELATVLYVIGFVSLFGTAKLSIAAPFVFMAAIFVLAHEGGWVSRLLKSRPVMLLGLLSYSLYMTHAFVIARLTNAATLAEKLWHRPIFVEVAPGTKIMADTLTGEIVVLALILSGTIVVSALTWRFIERPSQAIGKRLASGGTMASRRPAEAAQPSR
ncbi:acyltransferase [Aureimonas ureilytica]|uniref:Acyltransferase n=1 Tax=Aureimonas ureilytica TaxID=401562 RepID=A0A175R4T6_9HYPH|nr:acyltransferase [Aureimonas ureilytica]KTQ85145.1 acyltransferase [Aureimonas ureilytica]